MINLKEIKKEKLLTPDRILLYGMPKVGKSTFGAMAHNPIFLNIEDGIDNLTTHRIFNNNDEKTYKKCVEALRALVTQDHDFKTLVIDSADWLERLIYKAVAQASNVKSIDDIGYGKGYADAVNYWESFLNMLDTIRHKRGMEIIIICHVDVKVFNDTNGEAYNQYAPKLHGKTAKGDSTLGLLTEWVDMILFAKREVRTSKTIQSGKEVNVANVSEEKIKRHLYTNSMAGNFIAGNRLSMPEKMGLDYREFDKHRNVAKGIK